MAFIKTAQLATLLLVLMIIPSNSQVNGSTAAVVNTNSQSNNTSVNASVNASVNVQGNSKYIVDYKFVACGQNYACSGSGSCVTSQNANNYTFYVCSCSSGFYGQQCNQTQAQITAAFTLRQSNIDSLALSLNINTSVNANSTLNTNPQIITNMESSSVSVLSLASQTNLSISQQSQINIILNALLSGNNTFGSQTQLLNCFNASAQLSANILGNFSLSKADKRAQMNSTNTGAVRIKVISRVAIYLGVNTASNFVDLSNGNNAEVVVKIDVTKVANVSSANVITDPVTGLQVNSPSVQVPVNNITGAAYVHLYGTTCSNSEIDCDPTSTVVEVTVLDINGNVLNVTGSNINVIVPLINQTSNTATKLVCAYFDTNLNVLVTSGLTSVQANGQVTCTSTHLTKFTLTAGSNSSSNSNGSSSSSTMISFMMMSMITLILQ